MVAGNATANDLAFVADSFTYTAKKTCSLQKLHFSGLDDTVFALRAVSCFAIRSGGGSAVIVWRRSGVRERNAAHRRRVGGGGRQVHVRRCEQHQLRGGQHPRVRDV